MDEKPIIYNTPLGDIVILSKKFLQENYINLSWKNFNDLTKEEKEKLEKDFGKISVEDVEGQLQSEHHHIIWEMLKEELF